MVQKFQRSRIRGGGVRSEELDRRRSTVLCIRVGMKKRSMLGRERRGKEEEEKKKRKGRKVVTKGP